MSRNFPKFLTIFEVFQNIFYIIPHFNGKCVNKLKAAVANKCKRLL